MQEFVLWRKLVQIQFSFVFISLWWVGVSPFQIGNRVLYMFFTHVKELFGDVVLKPVVRPLRWSNMATMPALPETQESVKEEIRRQVGSVCLNVRNNESRFQSLTKCKHNNAAVI